jgi:hypothetical protein
MNRIRFLFVLLPLRSPSTLDIENGIIISAAGNNSYLSRHFITECTIRDDSGRSISCFGRTS